MFVPPPFTYGTPFIPYKLILLTLMKGVEMYPSVAVLMVEVVRVDVKMVENWFVKLAGI